MKRKMLALSMSVLMLVALLAGCGNSGSSSAASEPAAPEPAVSEPASPSSGTEAEPVTITVMHSGTPYENDFETEVFPKLVKEKFPHVTVEVTKLPDDQYYTSLKTKLASGEAPDMFLVQPMYAGANSVIGLAQAGYLEPINDLSILSNVSETALNALSYEGNVYSVPNSISILGTYYNANMFADNNLEVPTTWDDFLTVCQTLQDAGIQPIVMGDKDMYVMQFGLYQIAANEIYPVNPDFDSQLRTGETKFTDEDTWDKVLDMYTELYDRGFIDSSSLGLSAQQAIQMFIDGEAAMTFDGNFNVNALRAEGAGDVELGYFPLPGANGVYGAVAPSGNLAIYSGSPNIEICKEIMEYWLDGESDLWKANADNGRSIVTYGYGADQVDPLFQPFVDLYNEGKAFYWCNQAWPAGTENEMEAKLSEYIGGQGTTVDDITNAMQMKFEELLAAA